MARRTVSDTELCDMVEAFARDLDALSVDTESADAARRLIRDFVRRIAQVIVRDRELREMATDPRPPEPSVPE